ncbi:hypothetical protein CK620_13540 [Vandammella animalimorsus]|uniref:Antirestriction protein ArdR n=2 Tax=Vandammella animalimorsus TaxID=2029117 RepID=A0A2A2A6N5_9BURK|nr:hypothetical protein CK620_13540 [Vandammella animalimorsus]
MEAMPEINAGGVVLIYQGQAYGWRDCVRDPHKDRPGALAVDLVGQVWQAQGVDDERGAQAWVPVQASMQGGRP